MDFITSHSSYYFSLGCHYAFLKNPAVSLELGISFIELNSNNLEFFFQYDWYSYDREKHVIIICDESLLPLAISFQKIYMSIIAVFNAKDSLSEISEFIHEFSKSKERRLTTIQSLTKCEYETLKNAINGISATNEARSLNRSVKTVYTHRISAAHKLGVRSLYELFIKKRFQFHVKVK